MSRADLDLILKRSEVVSAFSFTLVMVGNAYRATFKLQWSGVIKQNCIMALGLEYSWKRGGIPVIKAEPVFLYVKFSEISR